MVNDYEKRFSLNQVENYVKSINWEKRLKIEIPFLKNLFKNRNYQNIVDLGCGPGYHAIKLSQEGFVLSGFDIDESMINFAQQQKTKVNFQIFDFLKSNPEIKEKFDAIFTLGNALMIIWTSEIDKHGEKVLEDIFSSLSYMIKSGGGLFFQILNSNNPRDGFVISKISTNEDNSKQMQIKHFIPVLSENKLHTNFSTLKWDENEIPETINSRKGYLNLIPLEKLKSVLKKSGFNDFEFYDNYNGDSFRENHSDSLLCFAVKK